MMIAIPLFLTIWSIDRTYGADTLSGKATYYGGNDNGNACGYSHIDSDTFPFGYYAACGGETFENGLGLDTGYGCGKCFEVTCKGPYTSNPSCYCDPEHATITISCMDLCPECETNHFDLNPAAMEYIVADGLAGTCGVIELEYTRVNCPITKNIHIRPKSGTSRYWYGLHIDDIAGSGSVELVEIKSSGKSTYGPECYKNTGEPSYWKCKDDSYPLDFPLSLRLTNDQGDKITCTGCIPECTSAMYEAGLCDFDFGTNFEASSNLDSSTSTGSGSGSSPVSSPTDPPVTPVSAPTEPPVASGSGGILVTQNNGGSQWWQALNIDASDLARITKLEYRDDAYTSWTECVETSWGYTMPRQATNGPAYSGSQHFRITTSSGTQPNWNVFGGYPCTENSCNPYRAPASATLATGSSFTYEEDGVGGSSLSTAGLIAIIIVALLCILCIAGGIWYYKREGINKGEASFQNTAADTPRDEPKVTDNNKEDEAEIEVEMNVDAGYDMSPIDNNETTR